MNYDSPSLTVVSTEVEPGAIRWRSPSNIALVKYWGKHGDQLPRNASVSFTLDGAATDTTLHYSARKAAGEGVEVELYFHGTMKPDFTARTKKYLERLLPIYPFLQQLSLRIETSNSFPHSAGIASSASGMSALALCLVSLEEQLFGTMTDRDAFLRKASYLARLGSGSASRSVYGTAALWGAVSEVEFSSDEYALPVADRIHPVFQTYHDDILLISKTEKSVSSRAGHGLMDLNPYAGARYAQANRRVVTMLDILRRGDTENFGELLESEALTLHALMMSSHPYYTLIEPNTLHVIRTLQQFRRETGHPVHFTLDAGPNVHLLYPDTVASEVRNFIREHLLYFCEDKMYLADRVGKGPQQLPVNETSSD
ncbi:diphosphomevalonate/mevalonate 3,5-bisphosphate decarboxylase family protein [Lewinella sp. JB7]|uniref:diphosphomevalonate/mevalonate 3,5-bisphosphate decarboxylase family protein n=1 Tax=Lewinella sp. JB7 TaxID=2962887 RepID=UPI0020C9C797|nr:diphosphomevalonate decarboxylase [Lewinella sp. JB7]MCP9237398.1 diphosphomevalonate decarboxylase [Lewinella sp. JB7]